MPIKYSVVAVQAENHGAARQLTDRWIPDHVRDDTAKTYPNAQKTYDVIPAHAGIQGHKEIMSLLPRMPGHDGERGNALFLILIAVALFAALSYAVTQSSRGGGSIDREEIQLAISRLENIATNVRTAMTRMQARGIPMENISPANDVFRRNDGVPYQTAFYYPNCTTNDCLLYHPDGGGLEPVILPDSIIVDYADPQPTLVRKGHLTAFTAARIQGVGTDLDERLLVFYNARWDVCLAFNDKYGIPNPPPHEPGCCGAYTLLGASNPIVTTQPEIAGKMEFCVTRDDEEGRTGRIVFVVGPR